MCESTCLFQLLPRTLESVVTLPECFSVNLCNGTEGQSSHDDMLQLTSTMGTLATPNMMLFYYSAAYKINSDFNLDRF